MGWWWGRWRWSGLLVHVKEIIGRIQVHIADAASRRICRRALVKSGGIRIEVAHKVGHAAAGSKEASIHSSQPASRDGGIRVAY